MPRGGVEVQIFSSFNLGARWGGWSIPGLSRFTPPGKTRYATHRRLGESQGRSGRVAENLTDTGIQCPDCPCHSELLYQLCYPGPLIFTLPSLNQHSLRLHDTSSRYTPPPEIRLGEQFTSGLFCLQRKHLNLWVILDMYFIRGGVVSTSPNPQAGGPPLVGCPRLLIQFIHSYPPYWRPFLHPQPEDAPCRGDRHPHSWMMHGLANAKCVMRFIIAAVFLLPYYHCKKNKRFGLRNKQGCSQTN